MTAGTGEASEPARIVPIETIYAELVSEFHLSMDQIADLTDWQIVQIYQHERDPATGQVRPPRPSRQGPTTIEEQKALFLELGKVLRVSEAEMLRRWEQRRPLRTAREAPDG